MTRSHQHRFRQVKPLQRLCGCVQRPLSHLRVIYFDTVYIEMRAWILGCSLAVSLIQLSLD